LLTPNSLDLDPNNVSIPLNIVVTPLTAAPKTGFILPATLPTVSATPNAVSTPELLI
jgi:hypothetical protein